MEGGAAAPAAQRWSVRRRHLDRTRLGWGAALTALLGVALALRLWGVASGLPYAYNTDEDQHFVPHAIALFAHGLNPNYFANPPAYTYLLAIVFALAYGGRDALSHAFATDPTAVWLIARVSAGVLGTIAVAGVYHVGARLFDRRTGLLAAALMAVAFLPVFYSKLALNDVPTLVPLTASLWGSAGVLRFGRRRDYAVAGIGLGLAAATKYTGGIVVLPLLVACLCRAREAGEGWGALRGALLAGALALAAFVLADPYSVLDFHAFAAGLAQQSATTDALTGKLGLSHGSGIVYYLWVVTWGVGWVPALAAVVGAVALAFEQRRVLAMFVPTLVVYLIFMGVQGRYFGRWLMPAIPLICLLAAYATLRACELLARRRVRLRAALIGFASAALIAQGFVFSVHSGLVNARADTRNLARAWLAAPVPQASRIVIEPVVPDEWALDVGAPAPTANGYRWTVYPALRTQRRPDGQLGFGAGTVVSIENYERTLAPGLVTIYERYGYCWVVTGSTQSGRAYVDPKAVPGAIAYYRALARDGTLVYQASPYVAGTKSAQFNFDWAFDYYPLAYYRPGALIRIYHLGGGRCGAPAR
jgi:4-amino-4-deoxy-L-arabinose transferase-like glycosyltransferase